MVYTEGLTSFSSTHDDCGQALKEHAMFSKRLNKLTPYVPGEQPQDRTYIKLNTNENPYPPSPKIAAFLPSVDPEVLRRYPDPQFIGLRKAIAERYGVRPDQVFAGNGSDEVLSFIFFAFFDSRRAPLFFPEHTYSFYPVYCDYYNIGFQRVPLAADFSIDLKDYLDNPSCGVIFPNPNAPTGIALAAEGIGAFLEVYPDDRVVVVDEAYVDFGAQSVVSLLDKHTNLLVVRTLSKSMSLAGLRLGFAMGHPDMIKALYTCKDSFNSYPLDALTQQIGILAMKDADYYDTITARIIRTRENFADELRNMQWHVLPSAANFVYASCPGSTGEDIYRALKAQGILVRYFSTPGLTEFVRITIGTEDEMARLVAAIGNWKD
jgi:histidinol-phosphate aminotransferase